MLQVPNSSPSSADAALSGFNFSPVVLVMTKYDDQHFLNPKGLVTDEFAATIN